MKSLGKMVTDANLTVLGLNWHLSQFFLREAAEGTRFPGKAQFAGFAFGGHLSLSGHIDSFFARC